MGIRIDRITLRELRMPLVHFFETSFGRTTERKIVLVEVESGGLSGWGEVTAGENPFYNEEWTESAWQIVKHYVAPRLLGKKLERAGDVAALTQHIRGHRMARGAKSRAACRSAFRIRWSSCSRRSSANWPTAISASR